MRDILVELMGANQDKKYVGATNSEQNSFIGDALPEYFYCNVRLPLQAADDVPNIIGREACSNGAGMTTVRDLYCYRSAVHYFASLHPFTGSHEPKNPSGVSTVKSLRPNCRATASKLRWQTT